jgi:hypothetical protein
MARRLGDRLLVMDACQISFVALWLARTAPERLELITEAMELARETGSERSFVVSACLRAAVLSELGRRDELFAAVDVARSEAERLRIAFGETVLDGMVVPWLAMAGRFEECDEVIEHLRTVAGRLSHTNVDESVLSSMLALRLWQGRPLEVVPILLGFARTPYPFAASVSVYLWRAGEHDHAREYHAEHGARLDHENEISLLAWCHAAELSLYLGERDLAAGAYERLVPYAGRNCCAGSDLALGPVDAYLAMAAATVGELELATRHGDAALAASEAWQIPLFGAWVRSTRETYGY